MKRLLLILFLLFSIPSFCCHESYTTLVSGPTAIGGGQYSTTVQFCIGQTVNWGGTLDFTVTLNGANLISYAPANLSNTYNAYTGASCGGPNCFMNSCASVTANATSSQAGNVVTYTTSSSTPAGFPLVPDDIETCGANAMSYCFNFTFVSDAYPTSIVLGGNIELTRVTICQSVCGHPATYTSPCNGTYDPAMTLLFTPLPVDFLDFEVYCDKFIWNTLTEINNNYYSIYYSIDTKDWKHIKDYSGGGNSNTPLMYEFYNTNSPGYYKLSQTDFDGTTEDLDIVYVNCITNKDNRKYIVFNILGQRVNENYNGFKFYHYID